ncbi:undecaprenyl-diphosphate phosphatase [Halococcus saccharolyticus]|uniref:Undecaprenyl-diphosphatase n=1 Tax=Halococcus saccharolyticus DSM 5350 TaxID=1227455 RepID=M0MR50_9EURY|nr:undecaprenyl-diphosphate phosphatase [Halococcus saccharolyticus]EMA47838.1 bacitracin resistance protein [Halococcus saccharolyticus DSM 5350]
MQESVVLAVVIGILQGVFEWLPISSEGNITLFLNLVANIEPSVAIQLSLFLHAGTALSALAYYRDEVASLVRTLPSWRPERAFDRERSELTFLVVATFMTGIVGIPSLVLLEQFVSELAGGVFVALIGALLIVTGLVQRGVEGRGGRRDTPDLVDAVLVGGLQGLAILPGISRSGTTASALLLRGHDGPSSFQLSFLLSIPASIGGGLLPLLDSGIPAIPPAMAAIALATSAIVGYLTIDALMRVVERVAFWGICVGLGSLAVLGGALVYVVV